MSHKAVRELIRDTALGLQDNINFGYGRGSDFNQIKNNRYPYIWLDPLISTLGINEDNLINSETYSISLVFYKFDKPDSTEKEYQLLLDETDKLVQGFIRKLNEDLVNGFDTPKTLRTHNTAITNIAKQPVIKVMADCLTGWILTFDFTVPDQFDYCSIYE